MKSDKATKRQVYRGNSRPSSRRGLQVRRAAEFKLESLEERTLLSTTKAIPPPSLPLGLGGLHHTVVAGTWGRVERWFAHAIHRVHHRISSDHGRLDSVPEETNRHPPDDYGRG